MKAMRVVLGLTVILLGAGCETLYNRGQVSDEHYEVARAEAARRQSERDLALIKAQLEAAGQNDQRLDGRLDRLEQQSRQSDGLRAELDALRRDVELLRGDREQLRRQIVDDLGREMKRLMAAEPTGGGTRSSGTSRQAGFEHKVQAGQTLSEIAKAYNSSVAAILKANNLKDANQIRVGQVLFIPD